MTARYYVLFCVIVLELIMWKNWVVALFLIEFLYLI